MAYRRDRNITAELPGYRRMLAHLTPTRGAATVYFTQTLDVTQTLEWLAATEQETGSTISFLHLFIAAVGRLLHDNPNLNRYATGHRIYQRDGVTISVSAKKALRQGSKVVLLKLPIEARDDLAAIVERFAALLGEGRSGRELHQEKEIALFLKLPAFLLRWAIKLQQALDRWHWLPGALVDPDPLYSSMVVANLGSVGLDAAYHHLYEYGNCPFFAVIGRIREEFRSVDGEPRLRKIVEIKYSFDERIDDGRLAGFGIMFDVDHLRHRMVALADFQPALVAGRNSGT